MKSIKWSVLLPLLILALAAPLAAELYEFPKAHCSIRIPDQNWVRDTMPDSRILLAARTTDSNLKLIVMAIPFSDTITIHNKRFIDGLVDGLKKYATIEAMRSTKLAGVDAVEIDAHSEALGKLVMVETITNGFIYTVTSIARHSDAAQDSTLRSAVASFTILRNAIQKPSVGKK